MLIFGTGVVHRATRSGWLAGAAGPSVTAGSRGSEAEWDRMVSIFKQVLPKHGVPDRETQELLEIVGSTKGDIVSG